MKHTEGELIADGHSLFIEKDCSRKEIAKAYVIDLGLYRMDRKTPHVDHEGLANAAEICKRYNAYPELIEALKKFLSVINRSDAALYHYGEAINEAETLLNSLNEVK